MYQNGIPYLFGKPLYIDTINGGLHIFDTKAPATSPNLGRAIQFTAGSKFIIKDVSVGDTITIKLLKGGNFTGYWNSTLNNYLVNDLFNTLPETWRNIISISHVGASVGGLQQDIEFRDVRIFLPSIAEIGLRGSKVFLDESQAESLTEATLSTMVTTDARKRYESSMSQSYHQYWTRSASNYSYKAFVQVTSQGYSSPDSSDSPDSLATNSASVVPIINI
jgi:hypothetical protein